MIFRFFAIFGGEGSLGDPNVPAKKTKKTFVTGLAEGRDS